MAWEKWPIWPNEGEGNWWQEVVDRVSWPFKASIIEGLQDIHRMKFYAEETKLRAWTTFDEAVEMLLQQKEEGKNCFINFNWVKIYSADTSSVDDAYIQYMWMTKSESEERSRKSREEREVSEREREKREQWYAKKIAESREWLKEVRITKENVIAGLKFIVEHQDMEQDQLVDELIKLGCNFTFDDIKKQFPKEVKVFSGIKNGDLWCGASVIANSMVSEWWRLYVEDRFLSVDDDTSAYAFIRKVTGDKSYTKELIDSSKEKTLWIEEGKKYIDESKWWDWEKYVDSSARSLYHWADIDAILELLKMIDNWESWEDVQKAFDDQNHSGSSYGIVRNRVVYFSKKWKEADNKLDY